MSTSSITNYIKGLEPDLKESDILRQVRDFLKWNKWFVIRIQQGLGSHKGVSDLIALKDGKTIFVEVKTRRGNLSEYQIKFKQDIENKGGLYYTVRSIDDIKEVIKSIK